MNDTLSTINKKVNHYFNKIKTNKDVKEVITFLTDTSTYKKTLFLSLFYVFLFYLPFTFITLFMKQVVFFQLDYVYQFSTIVFDFRNRVMDLNFSTWDFKNGIGYDYFANFYYIPLDITLLPYFLFPFLSFSQLMWLSFLLKVLLGTAAISYLLKLYRMSNKTILIISILYGTADLFFAQNVFPSYTGLTYYIPLVLISIEFMFKKQKAYDNNKWYFTFPIKNYLLFSLVIFQIFLFNSYWAWGLSLFMGMALLGRTIYEFFNFKNLLKPDPYINTLITLLKAISFYLLGLGLASFFFLPTFLGIMQNEPRMELSQRGIWDIFLDIFKTYKLEHGKMVYFKEFFKMLVPNLYMYSGFFHDLEADYWLTTNHMVIYSSIFATFGLFFFILFPTFLASKKLNSEQLKTFMTLKIATIIATVLLFFPFTSYLFSLNSGPYMRWLIFYGVLLIIDFAFIFEYKLFNNILFASFLVVSIGYLIFSIQYNRVWLKDYHDKHQKNPNIFTGIDESVAYTMIIVFIIMLIMIIVLDKYFRVQLALLIERLVGIGLIFSVCVSPYFSLGVRHADVYGQEINKFMKDVELPEYYTMLEYLFYDDHDDVETMQDMPYLFDFPVYNNFNIFHSLVNPYYTFYNTGHTRYFRSFDIPYMYYFYMDPSLFILSNSQRNSIKNGMYDPDSTEIFNKDFDDFESYLTIYKKDPRFSIGNGFTSYTSLKTSSHFDYLWLEALYLKDEKLIETMQENGFTELVGVSRNDIMTQLSYDNERIKDYPMLYFSGKFKEYTLNVSKDKSDVVVMLSSSKSIFSIDNDGNMSRCFSSFCLVPEAGIKSIVVDKEYPTFYTVNKDYINKKTEEILKYSTYDVKIDGNTITSKVDNLDKSIIMTYKIGYAKGWNAYVDGKKVDVFPSYNGQLSFIIKDTGTHKITLKYETPYLKQGILISCASLITLSGIAYLSLKKRG